VTSADAIVLSGYHSGSMTFGSTPLPGPGRFIGDLTPAGGSTWSANVAVTVTSNKFDMRALAVRAGSPVIIGGDGFSADFGYGKLTEGYLVGVDFTGTPLWQYADQRVVWDAA